MDVTDDFESILPDYPVRLANFEGPLDLLLHLIKKNEVDIYDIPIAVITAQYLEYLDLMEELDLDVAGEFLVMAATLIHIKSRVLVPRTATETEPEDEEDPRDVLLRRLLEHQKFKAAGKRTPPREAADALYSCSQSVHFRELPWPLWGPCARRQTPSLPVPSPASTIARFTAKATIEPGERWRRRNAIR